MGALREGWKKLWARRWFKVAFITVAVVLPAGGAVAGKGWHTIKNDPQFCVQCHLMKEPGQRWEVSAHHAIKCQTCHRADLFEEARFGWNAIILRKKEIGPHAKVPREICLECHLVKDERWPRIAGSPGHASHSLKRDVECVTCHVTQLHDFGADLNACTKCHGNDQLTMSKMSRLHCVGCHDFFGADATASLPDAGTCRKCHAVELGVSIPATTTGTAVPHARVPEKLVRPVTPAMIEKGRASLAAEAKKITVWKGHEDCLGCHRPHGKPLADPQDCLACHAKVLQPENRHFKDWRLQSCRECHDPHGKN